MPIIIGGPLDGQTTTETQPIMRRATLEPIPIKIAPNLNIKAIAQINYDHYYHESLRGKTTTFSFYRHESLDIDDALAKLFNAYNATRRIT